jgi:hypothetical protein
MPEKNHSVNQGRWGGVVDFKARAKTKDDTYYEHEPNQTKFLPNFNKFTKRVYGGEGGKLNPNIKDLANA